MIALSWLEAILLFFSFLAVVYDRWVLRCAVPRCAALSVLCWAVGWAVARCAVGRAEGDGSVASCTPRCCRAVRPACMLPRPRRPPPLAHHPTHPTHPAALRTGGTGTRRTAPAPCWTWSSAPSSSSSTWPRRCWVPRRWRELPACPPPATGVSTRPPSATRLHSGQLWRGACGAGPASHPTQPPASLGVPLTRPDTPLACGFSSSLPAAPGAPYPCFRSSLPKHLRTPRSFPTSTPVPRFVPHHRLCRFAKPSTLPGWRAWRPALRRGPAPPIPTALHQCDLRL